MNAYAKQGDPKAVQRIFQEMQVIDGILPDARSYSSLINAWSRSRQGRKGACQAEAIFDGMLNSNDGDAVVHPNEIIIAGVVDAWAKSGEIDAGVQAERMLCRLVDMQHRIIKENGSVELLKPNVVTYK